VLSTTAAMADSDFTRTLVVDPSSSDADYASKAIAVTVGDPPKGAAAAQASSPEISLSRSARTSLPPLDCNGEVFFEQLPDGETYLGAQDDVCYPFRAESSDDFVGTGAWITTIGWWGAYWSGSPVSPDAIRITLYAEDADGCPGEPLSSQRIEEYEENRVGSEASFCVRLLDPFHTLDDVEYALSIVLELCTPPQTGWATGSGNGREACFGPSSLATLTGSQ
jgi:hypothetical protein